MATRVYIGRLPYGVRERDVEKFFKGYGRIREILLKGEFGFVEFDDHRDADDAVYELNGKDLLGERIIVEFAKKSPRGPSDWREQQYDDRRRYQPPRRPMASSKDRYGPPTRTEYRLIVENLSSRCSWQDLKDHMREAGEITYADAHKRRRNEGVVEFASYRDMKTAIEKLDNMEINGRCIRLIEDKGKYRDGRRDRSYSRSRSRSRSRQRSRSHSRSASRSSRSVSQSRSRSRSHRRSSRSESKEKNSVGRHGSRSLSRSRSKSPLEKRISKSPSSSEHSDRSRSKSVKSYVDNSPEARNGESP